MDSPFIYLPIEDTARRHIIGNAVLAVLTTIVIALRMYGRHFSLGFGWDDLLVVFAWMCSMALLVEQGFLATVGDGYNFFQDDPAFPALYNNLWKFMQIVLSFQLLYMTSLTLVKCSVLLFYKRIFVNPAMQLLTSVTLGFVVCWCIAHSLCMVFICHPVAAWWDVTMVGGYCDNRVSLYISLIITNIFTDLVIMCLPMVTIWSLKMKTTEKLALSAAFALGIASIGVAIWRLVTIFQLQIDTNITGTVELAVFLCTLETILALFCVNIPLLRPLYRRFIVRQFSSKLDELPGRSYGAHTAEGKSDLGRSRDADVELDHYGKNQGFDRSVYIEEGSLDGDTSSEKKLNPSSKAKKGQILVKTEWTMDHRP